MVSPGRGQLIRYLLCFVCLVISISQALQVAMAYPRYDLIAITPKTWEEVDLRYHDIIDGNLYSGSIQLLRPIAWLKTRHMDKVGNRVRLSIPEFGLHQIETTVMAIKPTRLDTTAIDWSKQASRPVIGKFKRYAPIVKTYHFKDLVTGQVSVIHATPNHRFYVKNQQAFISISDVSAKDDLVNQQGHTLRLICPANKTTHCGQRYNQQPMPVYNLEVYRQHHYFVGKDGILVHNVYPDLDSWSPGSSDSGMSIREWENGGWIQATRKVDTVYRFSPLSPSEIEIAGGFKRIDYIYDTPLYGMGGTISAFRDIGNAYHIANANAILPAQVLAKKELYLYKIRAKNYNVIYPEDVIEIGKTKISFPEDWEQSGEVMIGGADVKSSDIELLEIYYKDENTFRPGMGYITQNGSMNIPEMREHPFLYW